MTTRRRSAGGRAGLAMAIGLGLGGALVGCGGSSGSAPAPRPAALAAQHPCGLITKAEAQAILGGTIRTPQEAPLGPTCVFTSGAGSVLATISLPTGTFDQLRPRVRNVVAGSAAGKSIYCGVLGQPMLWAPVDGTRLLVVSAACSTAELLAAKVLPRIS